MNLKIKDIIKCTSGILLTGNEEYECENFSRDTRTLKKRDTFVAISCYGGTESKINSSAYGGTSCVVKTIENLTDIKIDYYVKINFTGVVKLVDDLGGVEVDVPIKFCEQDSQRRKSEEYRICLDKGVQVLNGEQALALSRHRKTLPLGDFQRVQHQ